MVLGLALGVGGFVLPSSGATIEGPSSLERAHAAILERLDVARRFLGADVTNDVIVRLDDDIGYEGAEMPAGYTAADWSETAANVIRLDLELTEQVLAGSPQPLGAVRGLHENFIRVRDGTFQPIAVFVPSSYDASKAHSLIVALHGRPQSESELLAQPVLRRFAEASGSIVVAPWGRGNYNFAEPAASEVYDAIDAAEGAFAIDRHKVYLVGYSMGGFAVFKVAPLHAERWSGIMSISGAILNSEVRSFVNSCRTVNLYVVNGAEDTLCAP
jgi:poly(3-hydroxybutyrate) depolymerase